MPTGTWNLCCRLSLSLGDRYQTNMLMTTALGSDQVTYCPILDEVQHAFNGCIFFICPAQSHWFISDL
jgi:hypothetical protein